MVTKLSCDTPFHFNEFLIIRKPTGEQAVSLRELLNLIRVTHDDVIYHHMYRGYMRYEPQMWDYPNDFARWASNGLESNVLAERLANINPFEYREIDDIRGRLVDVIEEYLWDAHYVPPVRDGFEFHFERSTGIILPTNMLATSLPQFLEALAKSGLSVIYYHFFESRIRLGENRDDFSTWIDLNFDMPGLVSSIRKIDFYLYSLEDLRNKLAKMVKSYLRRKGNARQP